MPSTKGTPEVEAIDKSKPPNGLMVTDAQGDFADDEWKEVRQSKAETHLPSHGSSIRLQRTPTSQSPVAPEVTDMTPEAEAEVKSTADSGGRFLITEYTEDDGEAESRTGEDEDEQQLWYEGHEDDFSPESQSAFSAGGAEDEADDSVTSGSLPVPQIGVDIDDAEAYDTDLDVDDNELLHGTEEYDPTGIKDYIQECNTLGAIPVSYFARHVRDTSFTMRNHGLGPLGAKAIAMPLEQNTEIEHLDLEGNCVEAQGAVHLCRVLSENVNITRLILSENNLKSEGARSVCEMLASNKVLVEVDLSGNGFRDCDGSYFSAMLVNNINLHKLVLKHNEFEYDTALSLRDALAQNGSLRHLDLSWNHFRLRAAEILAEMIQENYGLKYVNLSMNGLGNGGAKAMGKALVHNQCLLELNIAETRINDEGALLIGKALEANDTLEILRMGQNPISPDGATPVINGYIKNSNSSLNTLDLTNIVVSKEFDELQTKLKEELKRDLEIIHGGVIFRDKNLLQVAPYDLEAEFERDPMTKLKKLAEEKKFRLVDVFRQFDKDQNWTVSKEDFALGVKSTGIEMSDKDIEYLMSRLNTNGNGEVDYSSFAQAANEHRVFKRQVMQLRKEKNEKARIVVDPFA